MHQLSRLEILIGQEKIEKIKNTTVLIIGLGGVGSFALESIIRNGIENVIIVDNDKIDITNINRQLIALHSNIGEYKTDAFERRIKDINPNCNVKKITKFITEENINELFENKIDYIIDACDTIKVKMELIRIATKQNIKIISSMSMGYKMNPERIRIMDIRKTSYDPIAKKIRKMVRDEKINKKIMVVCSDEKNKKTNTKTIGSNCIVPSTAGLYCASYIINDICGDIND